MECGIPLWECFHTLPQEFPMGYTVKKNIQKTKIYIRNLNLGIDFY